MLLGGQTAFTAKKAVAQTPTLNPNLNSSKSAADLGPGQGIGTKKLLQQTNSLITSPPDFDNQATCQWTTHTAPTGDTLGATRQQVNTCLGDSMPQINTEDIEKATIISPEFSVKYTLQSKPAALEDRNISKPEFSSSVQLGQPKLSSDSIDHQPPAKPYAIYSSVAPPVKKSPSVVESPPHRDSAAKPSQEKSNFITPRQIVPNKKVDPFITTLPLNGTPISHLTEWELVSGYNFGDNISNSFDFDGIIRINSQIQQSLTKNNIFTSEQNGIYLQLRTVRKNREVTVIRKDPQTLLGQRTQLSLTADCIFPSTNPKDQCTYTPGLVTDRNSIDPTFFVPTRILQTSNVGDVVTPESLAAIRQPGFQTGINGQQIGLDLYFPNAGALPGNSQTDRTSIDRAEQIDNTPALTLSKVRQIIRANDKEAVLGRTIRGATLIIDDKNTLLNSALQLGSQLLPDANPQLNGSTKPVNTNINRNLFLAANNIRIPENSFTTYQAGIGRASTPNTAVTDINQLPAANFNSVWIGLSPVTKRSFSTGFRYEATGPQRILVSSGAEGGVGSNVSFISLVNNQAFSTANLNNFYAQIYLTLFQQDINLIATQTLKEKTSYFPHISFTGDITGTKDVFRYYGGLIASEKVKPYLGLDYTRNNSHGWTYTAGAIGYVNPDRDYYSQLQGSVAKKISLSQTSNLIFSTGFNWALDRESRIGSAVVISPASSVTLGARANLGPVSIGLVNYFGNILPNSIANTLLTDLEVAVSKRFRVSAYFTPINESSSRSRYGAAAQLKLGDGYNSPTLAASWSNNEYDFGSDQFGRDLRTTENVFKVVFKVGEPSNPFSPAIAQRLGQQVDQKTDEYRRESEQRRLPSPVAP